VKSVAYAAVAACLLSACASWTPPPFQGGEPLRLSPAEAAGATVRSIHVTAEPDVVDKVASSRDADYRRTSQTGEPNSQAVMMAEMSLSNDVGAEIHNELRRCATGARPLNAVVRLDDLRWDERLSSLADAKGFDALQGEVELVDPALGNAVVGRYRIEVATNSGGLLTRILSDRTETLAEEFGRALCMEAFGRNPRGPAIENSTRG